jgi:hypothetical protein
MWAATRKYQVVHDPTSRDNKSTIYSQFSPHRPVLLPSPSPPAHTMATVCLVRRARPPLRESGRTRSDGERVCWYNRVEMHEFKSPRSTTCGCCLILFSQHGRQRIRGQRSVGSCSGVPPGGLQEFPCLQK